MNFTKAAKGIELWFRFHQIIGKGDLLNEDSIKYPLVEYLIADGDDSLKNIKLEDIHPVFTTREVDLISKDDKGKFYYVIEFKLASKFTMKIHERQRIFDDIARLWFVNHEHNIDAYLIVAGRTVDFLSEFRSVIEKKAGQRGRRKKATDKPKLTLINPYGFFSDKWLSFDLDSPEKVIKIDEETESVYTSHYENFKTNYLVDDQKTLQMPKNIKTILEYITEIKEEDTSGNVPAMIGIWKVCATRNDKPNV
jgi:hypothetical protein